MVATFVFLPPLIGSGIRLAVMAFVTDFSAPGLG